MNVLFQLPPQEILKVTTLHLKISMHISCHRSGYFLYHGLRSTLFRTRFMSSNARRSFRASLVKVIETESLLRLIKED